MKNLFKIIFLSLVLTINAGAQPVTWQKWYDYNNLEDNGEDAIQTIDGGYVIVSNSYTNPNPTEVFKTDKFGNLEWQKLYDNSNIGGDFLRSYSITQGSDSGYVISGFNGQYSSGSSGIIFKISKTGEISWIRRFPKTERIYDHKMTGDGGIIICGNSPNSGYLAKTDLYGNIEWDSVYSSFPYTIRIIESIDGSIYILRLESELVKISKTGDVLWRRILFLPNPEDLFENSSGHIFAGGGLDSMILYKIDTSGSVIFQKSYNKEVNGCQSMCLSVDGNILMAGNNHFTTVISVSKINPDGSLIFNKSIQTLKDPQFAFLPYSVSSTNDSGFIFTGFTNYPPNFLESNTYAAKTDSACNAPLMVGINNNESLIFEKYILFQNYPNPFNPVTNLEFGIPDLGFVSLKIYDVLGKEIKTLVNEIKQPGIYKVEFDGSNLSSGIYFYTIEAGSFIQTNRMVLLK